ncbi:MAG: ArsR/SmtB family transcription factor, partial [Bryobacteraceae bacterium]
MPLRAAEVNLIFRAFADPTRMRILYLLLHRELTVSEMVAILRRPQPTVSRHLAYLRRARLIRARRQGTRTFYRLAPPRYAFQRRLFGCLRSTLPHVPAAAMDLRRLEQLERG